MPTAQSGHTVVRGTPGDLYLALWNRGGSVTDRDGVLEGWHATGAIRW